MGAFETVLETSFSRGTGQSAAERRDPPESLGHDTRGVWLADLILLGAVLVGAMLLAHVFDKEGFGATAPGEETTVEIIGEESRP